MLVRNPRAPTGLFDGNAFDGSMAGEYRGSTYYHDASGLGNHGTLTNMDPATDWVWVPELRRWALDLVGASAQYVRSVSSATLKPAAVSFCTWAKTTDSNFGLSPLIWDGGSYDAYGFNQVRGVGNVNNVQAQIRTSAGQTIISHNRTNTGWTHLVGTFADGLFVLYVDGVEVASQDGLESVLSYAASGTQSLLLGARNYNSAYWTGQFADPLIYNRTLTPPEIQWLAQPQNKLWVPWRRTVWPVASAAATFNPAWARNCNNLIGAGI